MNQSHPDAVKGSSSEDKLAQVLRAAIRSARLPRHTRILVGFSGGRDSLALLAALRSIDVAVTAVHVDHLMREASAGDADRVADLARSLDVQLVTRKLSRSAIESHAGVGLEEALRRERYLAFAQATTEVGADVVALGHHQRDQAETILLHLLRGSGMRGVVGMRELSEMEVPWWGRDGGQPLQIWRPLLLVAPSELDEYVGRLGLPIVEDSSNLDRRFRRNAIRHDLLPLIERIVPGGSGNIARFGAIVGDEDAFLESLALSALADMDDVVPRSVFLDQPVVIRRRMVRLWLGNLLPDVEVSRDRVAAVDEAIGVLRGAKRIEIGSGWSVALDREQVSIVRG